MIPENVSNAIIAGSIVFGGALTIIVLLYQAKKDIDKMNKENGKS